MKELSDTEIIVPAGDVSLAGELIFPECPRGVVLFAHGSGSSRHSLRNKLVAATLREAGLATLLFDLLSTEEEVIDLQTTRLRFDIALLAVRLEHAIDWMKERESDLPMGLFGSSTGAGAALLAAAQRPGQVDAIVSRGGRPDLAGSALGQVGAPTLFIVGERDQAVMELNRTSAARMRCERKMEIVPGATHLFEEPGALEGVARLARNWFEGHFGELAAPSGREPAGARISEGL